MFFLEIFRNACLEQYRKADRYNLNFGDITVTRQTTVN